MLVVFFQGNNLLMNSNFNITLLECIFSGKSFKLSKVYFPPPAYQWNTISSNQYFFIFLRAILFHCKCAESVFCIKFINLVYRASTFNLVKSGVGIKKISVTTNLSYCNTGPASKQQITPLPVKLSTNYPGIKDSLKIINSLFFSNLVSHFPWNYQFVAFRASWLTNLSRNIFRDSIFPENFHDFLLIHLVVFDTFPWIAFISKSNSSLQ